jgi:hypothetical protein
MASKKRTSTKHYPVVRSANLNNPSGVPQNDRLVQLDRHLSKLNRRLYRMGRYYTAKIDLDPTSNQNIEVFALRDDWAVQKAFQMAYKAYMENTKEERASLSKSQMARWSDFRVSTGVTGADSTIPLLYDGAGVPVALTAGEFDFAQVADDAGTLRSFTWGSGGASTYGILEEYDKVANAFATPQSVTNDSPYAGLTAQFDTNVADQLQEDNQFPPYDQTGVNTSSPWVKIGELGTSAGGVQRLSTGYFVVPCGIIVLRGVGAATNDQDISFEVKAGDYKGVHAPSMLE